MLTVAFSDSDIFAMEVKSVYFFLSFSYKGIISSLSYKETNGCKHRPGNKGLQLPALHIFLFSILTQFAFLPVSFLLPTVVGNSLDLHFLKIMNTDEVISMIESLKSRCVCKATPSLYYNIGV